MKIKNVKPGDIIKIPKKYMGTEKENYFTDENWKVIKVYDHHVLTSSMKVPEIRHSFCMGDLVILGIENQGGLKGWI